MNNMISTLYEDEQWSTFVVLSQKVFDYNKEPAEEQERDKSSQTVCEIHLCY